MENQILYGVAKRSIEVGKISEYIIVKETPKTYIVKEKKKDFIDCWERVIRKSDMSIGSIYTYKLVKTYSEAVELAKEFIRQQIVSNNKETETLKKKNEILAEQLKELEANNEQRT